MSATMSARRSRRGVPQSALTTLAEALEALPADGTIAATGFSPLDDVLGGGPRPGELVLVGGKPGVGKTIACLQWARTLARHGSTAIYVSYEHDRVTLLTRLLACELGELAIAAGRPYDPRLDELHAQLRDVAAGTLTLSEALDSDPWPMEAHRRLAEYGDRLIFVEASGASTDIASIIECVSAFPDRRVGLFVDYLHKIPTFADATSEADRIAIVTQNLKEIALDRNISVVAVAAADQAGLAARRVHMHHFRGSTALAYEADAIILLNEKADIVSKVHVASAPARIDEFRRRVVFTIEKNRNGSVGAELEFVKDFTSYRFEPRGSWVPERLWTQDSVEL